MLLCLFPAQGQRDSLSLLARNTAQKTCLSLSESQHAIESLGWISSFKMDPSGRWVLYYTNDPRAFVLLDLQTKRRWTFSQTAENSSFYDSIAKERYGFTHSENPSAYILQDDFFLLTHNLKTGQQAIIPLKTDDRDLLGFYVGGSKNHLAAVLTSEPYNSSASEALELEPQEASERFPFGFQSAQPQSAEQGMGAFTGSAHKAPGAKTTHLNILELDHLESRSINLFEHIGQDPLCFSFREDQLLFSGSSGALYSIPLFEEAPQARLLFGPLSPLHRKIKRKPYRTKEQCLFSKGLQILRGFFDSQFVFRDIDEGKEFFVSMEDLISDWPNLYENHDSLIELERGLINWPYLAFIADLSEGNTDSMPIKKDMTPIEFYHIPSGASFILNGGLKQEGQLTPIVKRDMRFRFHIMESAGELYLDAILLPQDPTQEGTLTRFDYNLVCSYFVNKSKSLSFVNTIDGQLFVFDRDKGSMESHFIGHCLNKRNSLVLKKSGLSFTSLIFNISLNNISEDSTEGRGEPMPNRPTTSYPLMYDQPNRIGESLYQLYHIEDICFQPLDSLPSNADLLLRNLLEDEEIETPRAMALLAKALEEQSPSLYRFQILQNIMGIIFLHRPYLYLNLIKYFPYAQSLPLKEAPESLQAQAKNSLISVLETASRRPWSKLSDWDFILKLKAFMPLLTDNEKRLYIGRITESLSNGAMLKVPLFQNVFQSKLYYIILGHVRELFGEPRRPVSDITVLREQNEISVMILSSDPLQSDMSLATDFGVHYRLIAQLKSAEFFQKQADSDFFRLNSRPQDQRADSIGFAGARSGFFAPPALNYFVWEKAIEWRVENARSYRAKIRIQPIDEIGDTIKSVSNKTSPDYNSAWEDAKMTGMVLVGSSLRDLSENLSKHYINYFLEEGFLFHEPQTIELKPFLLEKIAQCEIDWLLNESHGGGNERHILRLDRFNRVLKGVRPAGSDKEEAIYLVFPRPFSLRPGGPETDLLSFEELRQAIRVRESRNCGELTYFNTGCWSYSKARYEIGAVGSALFLQIPAISMTDTFLNRERSALRLLIQSYREERDFSGFRSALNSNQGYREGEHNRYLFPDEAEYFEKIIDHIKMPLSISIDLERQDGGKWRAIDPDRALSSY